MNILVCTHPCGVIAPRCVAFRHAGAEQPESGSSDGRRHMHQAGIVSNIHIAARQTRRRRQKIDFPDQIDRSFRRKHLKQGRRDIPFSRGTENCDPRARHPACAYIGRCGCEFFGGFAEPLGAPNFTRPVRRGPDRQNRLPVRNEFLGAPAVFRGHPDPGRRWIVRHSKCPCKRNNGMFERPGTRRGRRMPTSCEDHPRNDRSSRIDDHVPAVSGNLFPQSPPVRAPSRFRHRNQGFELWQCLEKRSRRRATGNGDSRMRVVAEQMIQQAGCKHRITDPVRPYEQYSHDEQAYTRPARRAPNAGSRARLANLPRAK